MPPDARPLPVPVRRRILAGTALLGAPALLLGRPAHASVPARPSLSFLHLHTGETLSVGWTADGRPERSAQPRIDRLLRDFRTGEVHPIDPALLEQLVRIAALTGTRRPFEVVSAFRSDRTNEMLRRAGGGGVARGSLHLHGRAIDLRLADVPLADLRDTARSLNAGGVGYYPQERFVHLDTGRVRAW